MDNKLSRLTLSIIAIVLAAASAQVHATSLNDELCSYLSSKSKTESYISSIILGNISVDEGNINKIKKIHDNEKNKFKILLSTYILAKKTQEQEYIDEFISLYPIGNEQKYIWDLQTQTGYPMGLISPLQEYLSELSKTDDIALKKLVSGLPVADGVHAESLADQIADLYLFQQERITNALSAWPNKIDLIKEFAGGKCRE